MRTAKVLVPSDNADDARQVQRQLKVDFSQVQLSVDADLSLEDSEQHGPDVLVLAFDSLDKAQRHYLGLYRLGGPLQQHPHRTVILCSTEEKRRRCSGRARRPASTTTCRTGRTVTTVHAWRRACGTRAARSARCVHSGRSGPT
jgi:hypothetical protein